MIAALLWVSPARGAQGDSSAAEEARQHQSAAFEHFAKQQWVPGIEAMEKAYKLDPLPKYVLNIAVAWDKVGDPGCTDALATYNRYLTLCAKRDCPNRQAAVERRQKTITRCGLEDVASPTPVPTGEEPAKKPEPTPAAAPAVVATDEVPPPERSRLKRTLGWIGLGVGVAFGVAGTVTGIGYNDDVDEAKRRESEAKKDGSFSKDEVDAARADARDSATTTAVLLGASGVFLISGGVLLYLDAIEGRDDQARLGPGIGPGWLGLSGAF